MDKDKNADFRSPTDEEQAAQREKEHTAHIDRRERLADEAAHYYASLIKRGVPDSLAQTLTRDWHTLRMLLMTHNGQDYIRFKSLLDGGSQPQIKLLLDGGSQPQGIASMVRSEMEQLRRNQV